MYKSRLSLRRKRARASSPGLGIRGWRISDPGLGTGPARPLLLPLGSWRRWGGGGRGAAPCLSALPLEVGIWLIMCWLFYSIPPPFSHTPCPGAFPFTEFEYSKSHQDDTHEKHLIKGDFRGVNTPNRASAGGGAVRAGKGGRGGSRLGAGSCRQLGEFVCGELLAAKSIFRP